MYPWIILDRRKGMRHRWNPHGEGFNVYSSYENDSRVSIESGLFLEKSWRYLNRKNCSPYLVHFSVSLCYCIHHRRYCHHPDHDIPLWYWTRTMTILTFYESSGSQASLFFEPLLPNYFTFGVCWGCFTLDNILRCRWKRAGLLLVLSRDPLIGVSFDILHTFSLTLIFFCLSNWFFCSTKDTKLKIDFLKILKFFQGKTQEKRSQNKQVMEKAFSIMCEWIWAIHPTSTKQDSSLKVSSDFSSVWLSWPVGEFLPFATFV